MPPRERQIPSLGDLCFRVLFKEMVCKATPNTSESIRALMDNHLVGRVKKNVR